MSNKQDEQDRLQDVIEGLDEVIQAYEKTRDLKSPEHINASIRAAAREAVADKSGKGPLRPDWLIPLSLAATVVVAIGIVQFYPGNPFGGRDINEYKTRGITTDTGKQIVTTTKRGGRPAGSTSPAITGTATSSAGGQLKFEQPLARDLATLNEHFRNDPKAWLRHIINLQNENKVDEARENLAAFKQFFPEYRIPGKLRKLLKKD